MDDLLTHCDLKMPYGDIGLINMGSGNGLSPDSTKPLHAPTLTHYKMSFLCRLFKGMGCGVTDADSV